MRLKLACLLYLLTVSFDCKLLLPIILLGKTVTLAAMMASLKHGGLVLASSNAAVANIAVKLLSVSKLSVRDIIVYGDNCNETVEFLSPVHRSRRYRRFKKHFAASQSNNHTEEELIREFLAWLRLDPTSTNQNEMLNEIERHCPMIDAETSRGQVSMSELEFISRLH